MQKSLVTSALCTAESWVVCVKAATETHDIKNSDSENMTGFAFNRLYKSVQAPKVF